MGTVPEAFGSCTIKFGEEETQIVCAIKAEIMKPLPSEPNDGQINLYLETC
jgi:exosome complex RNA-binding protein Rrp42 (RNase PH superfamily)